VCLQVLVKGYFLVEFVVLLIALGFAFEFLGFVIIIMVEIEQLLRKCYFLKILIFGTTSWSFVEFGKYSFV